MRLTNGTGPPHLQHGQRAQRAGDTGTGATTLATRAWGPPHWRHGQSVQRAAHWRQGHGAHW